MGTSPKTKADCDRRIASLEKELGRVKSQLALWKNGNVFGANISGYESSAERLQGEINSLKAKRNTLK